MAARGVAARLPAGCEICRPRSFGIGAAGDGRSNDRLKVGVVVIGLRAFPGAELAPAFRQCLAALGARCRDRPLQGVSQSPSDSATRRFGGENVNAG